MYVFCCRETLIYNVNINENRNCQEPYIDKENNSDVGVSSVLVEGSMNNQKFAGKYNNFLETSSTCEC